LPTFNIAEFGHKVGSTDVEFLCDILAAWIKRNGGIGRRNSNNWRYWFNPTGIWIVEIGYGSQPYTISHRNLDCGAPMRTTGNLISRIALCYNQDGDSERQGTAFVKATTR